MYFRSSPRARKESGTQTPSKSLPKRKVDESLSNSGNERTSLSPYSMTLSPTNYSPIRLKKTLPNSINTTTVFSIDSESDFLLSEKIVQRETNLENEKRKLYLARQKLFEDFEDMEKMKKTLEDEREMMNLFSQGLMLGQSEVGKQSLFLRKIAVDLKNELENAKRELQGLLQSGRRNEQSVMKQIETQHIKIQKLQELLNLMNEEIMVRENSVIQMELVALEHKKKLDKTIKFKQQIDQRRIKAEQMKKQLKDLASSRLNSKEKMEERFNAIKQRLAEAHAEKDRIKRMNDQYDQKVADIEKRKKEIEERRKRLNERKEKRIKEHKEVKEELERRLKEIADNPIDPNLDINALQIQVEKEERAIKEKTEQFEIKNNQIRSSLLEQKNKLVTDINSIKDFLNGERPLDELLKELKDGQADNAELLQSIEKRKKEIAELQSLAFTDEELVQKKKEMQNELMKIMELERELKAMSSRLDEEEYAIESSEETIRQTKADMESERKMIVLKEEAADKMVNLLKKQIVSSEERYKSLIQQIENLNNGDGTQT